MSGASNLLAYLAEHGAQILALAGWHLLLSLAAVGLALLVGLPLGVLCYANRLGAALIIGIVSIIYTIPTLALLGLMIPLLGIGAVPAVIAVLLYSLLPIVQNTYTGLSSLDATLREAAAALGMGWCTRLLRVELPLALPVIFAGVRVSVVNAIGMVTLASLVAAGGLGDPIFRGISILSWAMILSGSVPVLALALIADELLKLAERSLGSRWAVARP